MKTITITDENFEAEVLKSETPVLIDFWATWCGPCKMIAPIVEELVDEYEGKAKIGKLDVDNNQQTAIKFGVRSIPTILIFKNGKLKDTIIGAVPKGQIVQKLNLAISQN
jgi:thioredoxin 1